ncbi:MAG TPA: hypothetical protein VFY48_04775 [Solirubrobacterales bacterium]|nr:hypothetical protein [Solirubrobacterales bacterium]
MAVAAPARRAEPAPAPSRTTPPKRKAAPARPAPRKKAAPARVPRTRPKPRAAAAAPARKAPARRAPARRAPARRAPARRVGGQLIPLAGRTAVAVGQLPDSGLVVRLTRGRAWIGVLGVLLAGIVALNVLTLSFAASASKIDAQAALLDKENSILTGRDARLYGTGAMRNAAGALGLAMPSSDEIQFTDAGPDDAAVAAQRLAAAGG